MSQGNADGNASRAADMILNVWRTRQRIEQLPEEVRPASLDEAFAIQENTVAGLCDMHTASVIGHKCGATNDGAMKNFALEKPFRGILLSSFARKSPAVIDGPECFMRVLEVEFAFRMADDLPPAAAPYDMDAVMGAIGSVIPAIEVVDSRFADWLAVGGLQIIADNGAAGYWVYGDDIADWQSINYEDFDVSLSINGEVVREGNASGVLGSPLQSLAWIANDLCLDGKGLKKGDIVTTGSCTAPIAANPGDNVVASFGDLGEISISFGE